MSESKKLQDLRKALEESGWGQTQNASRSLNQGATCKEARIERIEKVNKHNRHVLDCIAQGDTRYTLKDIIPE